MALLLRICFLSLVFWLSTLPAQAATTAGITWYYNEKVDRAHPGNFEILPNGNILYCRNSFHDPAVVELTPAGKEVWRYGPLPAAAARRLKNGHTLIADSGMPGPPRRPAVLEVDGRGRVIWRYEFPDRAEAPRYIEPLEGGRILVVTRNTLLYLVPPGQITWRYTAADLINLVSASCLPGGHILLVDAGLGGRGKVREIDARGKTVWEYRGEERFGGLQRPVAATRLRGGLTLIVDAGNNRLLVVSKDRKLESVNGWPQLGPVTLWSALPQAEDRIWLALSRYGQGQLVRYQGRLPKILLDGDNYFTLDLPLKTETAALFPARELFSALGATLDWDQAVSSLNIAYNSHNLSLQVGRLSAMLDRKPVRLQAPPVLSGGRLFIPPEVFSLLGGGRWDSKNQILYLERQKGERNP
ncbi:MAG: hypothetical protein PWP65_1644 [Clostridia bacterium]|nr:hypothetical protein [Clostridia bacterium]